jgi:CPA1 family monovalent cation:H+ antiporter
MILFEWTILLLLGAVLLAAAARRLGVPYPAFLALGGAALAFVPGAPRLVLEPELALALFLAPILLDAAYDTSLRDLGRNWLPVGALVVFAVSVTTAAVALVTRLFVPDIPWAAAVALGAIVAPPDAAAATAVLRQVQLPRRILTILEGESLLNDATSLLLYRAAVAAAVSGVATWRVVPSLLFAVVGGLAAGVALALLFMRLTIRIADAPSAIVIQFVSTFGVWMISERLGLSAVITLVAYAITLARRAPALVPARLRVPSYAVWETGVFVLNVLAFVLIGLQLSPIWSRVAPGQHGSQVMVAVAVLATTIVARFAWVMSYDATVRWRARRGPGCAASSPQTIRGGLLVSWCGMRGIVSLAAALALPDGRDGTPAFPYRDLILLAAFAVVLGTLVVQGFTLGPLLRRLELHDEGELEREIALARTSAWRAALGALAGDPSPAAARLRSMYQEELGDVARADGRSTASAAAGETRRRAIAASRRAVAQLRSRGEIGDEAFHHLEQDFDWQELSASSGPVGSDSKA